MTCEDGSLRRTAWPAWTFKCCVCSFAWPLSGRRQTAVLLSAQLPRRGRPPGPGPPSTGLSCGPRRPWRCRGQACLAGAAGDGGRGAGSRSGLSLSPSGVLCPSSQERCSGEPSTWGERERGSSLGLSQPCPPGSGSVHELPESREPPEPTSRCVGWAPRPAACRLCHPAGLLVGEGGRGDVRRC